MPETSATSPAPISRVIIELGHDGQLMMEFYSNGQRTRTRLDRGNEWWQVIDELHTQRKAAQSAAERKAQRETEASRKLHRNIWIHAAENHGVGFATKVIKGEIPIGYGKYINAGGNTASGKDNGKAPAKDKPLPNFTDLADLL